MEEKCFCMRVNKKKKVIIASLIAIVFVMTVAYGAFMRNLNISGTTSITSKWEILITNVAMSSKEEPKKQKHQHGNH